MRMKSIGGGRARLSNLPPQPSVMAIKYLCQPTVSEAHQDPGHDDVGANEANNDDQRSTVAETSSDSNHNRQRRELAPDTTGEMVVLAEKSCGLGTQEIRGPADCLEMDWAETEVCIICDKGGKLLVCSDSNCPLAVHEECMHCSTRFDGMGNFYCPYCSYKRAMLETRKARKKAMLAKKALSVFLDKGKVDGDPHKQKKAERDTRKEPNRSAAAGDAKADDSRNRLNGDEADYHFSPIEGDPHEVTFDLGKDAKASAVNEQNDFLSRCAHNARPDDGAQCKVVIEHMQPGPIIAYGGNGTCCTEEETGCQFEIVQVDKVVKAEHPKLVDDHQNERLLQDEQQPGTLAATLVEKEAELDGEIRISTAGELDNSDVVKEHEGSVREAKAEALQDEEKRTTLSSSGDDFMEQKSAEDSDLSHGDNGCVSPHWRRIKKKNQNGIRSPSVHSPRRTARKLPKLNTVVAPKDKKHAVPKSRHTSPMFPHARRKKLPWTSDEEEMLKEGVQKFSTTANKNLPWRKILDFGCHVFEGTRTPGDLKDKWRNISKNAQQTASADAD